jgi:hypothetical protein
MSITPIDIVDPALTTGEGRSAHARDCGTLDHPEKKAQADSRNALPAA